MTTDAAGEASTVLATTTAAAVTAAAGEASDTRAIAIDPETAIGLTAAPARPTVGQPVAFEITLRNEARAVRSAAIDFGDGHTHQLRAAATVSATHTYATAGGYTVTVTAIDTAGHAAAASISFQVRPAPGIAVAITASPAAPTEGQPVTFVVDVSRPAGAPAVRDVTLEFGDLSEAHAFGPLTGRASVAHIYADAGSYIATVAVLDAAGREHASSIGIVVAEN